MVPSLTAVDADGIPDHPGPAVRRQPRQGCGRRRTAWASWWARRQSSCDGRLDEAPDAAGYWPAPAVANHALAGEAVIDFATAFTTLPLFDGTGWNARECADCGASVDRMPRVEGPGAAVGQVRNSQAVLAAGAIDAVCEQMVAGADEDGDVLVLCGTTLIVWATIPEWPRGARAVDNSAHRSGQEPDRGSRAMPVGCSSAGSIALSRRAIRRRHPGQVPVWSPYVRGERTPYHDPDRRAVLDGLNLAHDAASVRRAAYEASGFVVRQLIELGAAPVSRIVATGGGTRVEPWMQAIADATGLPVEVSGVPEGAALGAAFLARMAAGLESSIADAARWASVERTVEPDPAWKGPMEDRYGRFLELSDGGRRQPGGL